MVDPAAMAVDGGNANGEARVAHAIVGDGPNVDRSTDPEMLRQLQLSGLYNTHDGPIEVVAEIPVIADHRLYDVCVRNRARERTRSIHAQYEALRALSTCWPNPARPAMLVTAWPSYMGIRSSGSKSHIALYTRSCRFATKSFVTKCRCIRYTA